MLKLQLDSPLDHSFRHAHERWEWVVTFRQMVVQVREAVNDKRQL